ncbi:hypothetical protein GJAV_G00085000 [Gymnothorax javanicus]|nr:hypothetical protein GJAV_G00085000 [Gymnothorax javanicus]
MFYPQKQLAATQSKFQKRIQEREKELQDLRQAVQSLKLSAQAAVEDSERIFTELIRSIERRRSEVKELIRDQEKADSCQSVCTPPEPGDLPSITLTPHNSFEAVRKSVSELKERLEDVLRSEFISVSEKVDEVSGLTRELKTRRDFLRYSCQLTLDPNTAHQKLRLSEGNREVTRVKQIQSYPDHPERFDNWEQVLCREGLSGRCYWEAEWSGNGGTECSVNMETESSGDIDTAHDEAIETNSSGDMETELSAFFDAMWEEVVDSEWSGDESDDRSEDEESDSREDWEAESEWVADLREGKGVEIGVSYKDISREGAGDDCALGNNSESWMLYCSPSSYSFWHKNKGTKIPVPSSSRIGVYLDHRAGTLSFYSVSDTMTLLHRVQTTFTQPLYPGFWVQDVGSSVKLCDLVYKRGRISCNQSPRKILQRGRRN